MSMRINIKLNRSTAHILKITQAHQVLLCPAVLRDVVGGPFPLPLPPEMLLPMGLRGYCWLNNAAGAPLGLLFVLTGQPGKRLVVTVNREGLYEASLFKQRGPAWAPLRFDSNVPPAQLHRVVAALAGRPPVR